MKLRFFRCNICGNIIVKMIDSGVKVVCCGQQMTELEPGTSDGAGEKHIPIITEDGNRIRVVVSTVEHPSVPAHYIQFIAIETDRGHAVKHLQPGDKPEAEFVLAEGEHLLAAYEYCNLHGLWKTEK